VTEDINVIAILAGFQKRLKALLEEQKAIAKRNAAIQRQIVGVQQTVSGMMMYAEPETETDGNLDKAFQEILDLLPDGYSGTSLIDTCRNVLKSKGSAWLSPREVRRALDAAKFDFSEYTSNPLSSIHTTLKRLKAGGEVEVKTEGGSTYYRWPQPTQPLPGINLLVNPYEKKG
jgi:hypothetical protein